MNKKNEPFPEVGEKNFEKENLCECLMLKKWLADTYSAHIESVTTISDKGIAEKKFRVLIIYKPDTKKFPGSKYSSMDFTCPDLLSAITEALQLI
jgi:hypothetical protein